MNKYTCRRCGIRNGVKEYQFKEDGFLHTINLCDCCAFDESDIGKKALEFKKEKEKEIYGNKTNNL